jgi:hypothetical protein
LEGREVPAGVVANYAVTQDWGSGFQASLSLVNSQPTAVADWRLEFDLAANITSIWDAQVVSHSGNHYFITGAAWDSNLSGGGTVSFGFVASPGHVASPSNYVLGGVPLGGTTPPPLPTLSVNNVSVPEGNSGTTAAVFSVTLSAASAVPVTLQYATADGTATAGSDYQAAGGTLTFAPGETSKMVTVQVIGDTVPEPNETFFLNLSNPTGATLAQGQGTGTILDDNTPPAGSGDFPFQVTSDWGSGFTGQVNIRNSGSTAVTNWSLELDFPGQITSIWDATVASHAGNHYVVQNAGWNSTIAAGATVSFGFNGSPGNVTAGPTNYVLHGDTGAGALPVPAPSAWPAHVFAPYVDMTLYPTYDLVSAAKNEGLRYFTLAFVVADANKLPAWGGYTDYEVNGGAFDTALRSQIAGLRAQGGDVSVSFGGAAGQELAQVITDITALKIAYQSVIDTYGLTHIDFDIEGAAVADHASIDRRSQAIAALQQAAVAAGKELDVSFTLPVLPSGLTADGLYVLQSALRYGVKINTVNVMAMDYGDSAAPAAQGQMGGYAIQAATSLFGQLQGLYGTALTDAQRWRMIGVTPMIGLNDVTTETFTPPDAQQLLAFARQRGLGELAMWSLNRDRQNAAGTLNWVDTTSSSIIQQPFEFSLIFHAFTG